MIPEFAIFTGIFMLLRTYAGGVHLNSFGSCFICSVTVQTMAMYFNSKYKFTVGIAWILICYTGTNDENVFMKCELEDISRKLNEISCSSNRMANYFEGRFFLKSDVINAYPSSSMYKDLKDAINKTEREEIKENTRDELGNLHIE